MARPDARSEARKPSRPNDAVAALNARGVFDTLREREQGDDQATLLVRRSQRDRPVSAAAPRIPAPPRMPVIHLETVSARAPRQAITTATESTPAVCFDADSGEYSARTPTMPVPRMPSARPIGLLPYLAAGVLALAAGALVVLLAGAGSRSAFPTAWATGAAATASTPQAPWRASATAPPAALPGVSDVPVDDAAPPPVRTAPRRVLVVPKGQAVPAPKAARAETKAAPKLAKAGQPGQDGDEDLVHAKEAANAASTTLGDSL